MIRDVRLVGANAAQNIEGTRAEAAKIDGDATESRAGYRDTQPLGSVRSQPLRDVSRGQLDAGEIAVIADAQITLDA